MKSEYLFRHNVAELLSMAVALLLCLSSWALSAQKVIGGTCIDENGEPLAGVAIALKGTMVGTMTDGSGKFSINAKEGDVLEFQFLGYKTITLKASDAMTVNMVPDNTTLEESVVVGYGVQKRRDVIGAIETISGEELAERKTANVSRALQGAVPGLTLTFSDGKPTRSATIRIRAVQKNSIGSGGEALVLVDGVEADMNTVNPDDIESISVLKDASSTAIYGSKGAFGVIYITTKAPKGGDKVNVSYDGSVSVHMRTTPITTVTDPVVWMSEYIESYKGRYNTNPTVVNNVLQVFDGGINGYFEEIKKRSADPSYEKYKVNSQGYYEYYGNYDWHDIVYKKATTSTQHALSVTGGNKIIKFSVSGRYFTQDGIYRYGKENYEQFNTRAKIDVRIFKWLSLDDNISFMRRNTFQPRVAEGNQLIQRQIEIVGAPMIGPKNPDGTWTEAATYIGVAGFDEGTSWEKYHKIDVSNTVGLNAFIVKDILKARGEFTYFYNHTTRLRARNIITHYNGPEITGSRPSTSQYHDYQYETARWNASATLTYGQTFAENHRLSIVAGINAEAYGQDTIYTYREGILYPDKVNPSLINGDTFKWQDNGSSEYSLFGVFGRASYSYASRYLVEASVRYDGNSKFPTTQKWGFFPSGSFGWRISEEPFMSGAKNWLDNLKIRASIGTAGNGLISNAYAYLSTMSVSQSSGTVSGGSAYKYTAAPSPVPSGLTWEKSTTYDLGIDFEALNGKINIVADVYSKLTTNMYVVGAELPAVFGNSAPKGNYADMRTVGWEASISWRDSFAAGASRFGYFIKGAVWDNQSVITRYTSKTNTLPTIYNTSYYYEGMTLGEIWGYQIDGLFESDEEAATWANQDNFRYFSGSWKAGDLKIADLDNSGVIDNGANTLENHGDLKKIGSTAPRYCYSFSYGIDWNGIGFSMMWQGVGHRDWYPAKDSGYFWGKNGRSYGYSLPWQGADYRYTDENQNVNAYWPRLRGYQAEYAGKGIMTNANTRYLQNAAYLRLKNITLDYTLPVKISRKAAMEKLRFYISGENIAVFSPLKKYAKNYDPEGISAGDADFASTAGTNGDGYGYPVMSSWTFGISVTF